MTTPSDRRRSASAAVAGETAARNSANIATNTASNAGASALLGALPGPLGAAATALSEGISTAIKASAVQAKSVPSTAPSAADPTKLFAAQLAFAIITAIWCFIKSILNPLPIIGMFFPLCSDEDRARNATTILVPPTSDDDSGRSNNVSFAANTPQQDTISDVASSGITFQSFLASPNRLTDPYAAPPRAPATPLVPQQPPQQPNRSTGIVQLANTTPTTGVTETSAVNNPSDIRKLFGL